MKESAASTLAFLFFFLFLFLAPAQGSEVPRRGLFVSAIENPLVLSDRQSIEVLVDFAKKARIQVLFVQIYRSNRAWFPSALADSTPYESCFKKVGEDPFSLLIKKAHTHGIQVHAWMNLLSLSTNEEAPLLKKYGPEILTRNLQEKKTLADYKIDNQYFLEPGDLRVQDTLSKIVGEVVRAYPALDGIQLDYIRYPDVHPSYGYTQRNMDRFKQSTGIYQISEDSPAWKQWKYAQVTGLVRRIVRKARSIRPNIQVSTTGLMSYSRASLESFQDWRAWLQTNLVDFVTLMCYGNNLDEFKKQLEDAVRNTVDLKKVNIAVGTYKFLKTPEVFQQQFSACEEAKPRSCVVFYYGNLLENPELAQPLLSNVIPQRHSREL